MIPAILAAPAVVGGVSNAVSGVLGSVAGLFSHPSSTTSSTSISPAAFKNMLSQASSKAHASALTSTHGTMTPTDWSAMSAPDLHTWLAGLAGKHVQAVDSQGKAISGIVQSSSQTGGIPSLNIGGHLVSLSNMSQITWSPAVH